MRGFSAMISNVVTFTRVDTHSLNIKEICSQFIRETRFLLYHFHYTYISMKESTFLKGQQVNGEAEPKKYNYNIYNFVSDPSFYHIMYMLM